MYPRSNSICIVCPLLLINICEKRLTILKQILLHFYTPVWKTGHIMGRPAAGERAGGRVGGWAFGRRPRGFRSLSQRVFIRSLSNVLMSWIMALDLSKKTEEKNREILPFWAYKKHRSAAVRGAPSRPRPLNPQPLN